MSTTKLRLPMVLVVAAALLLGAAAAATRGGVAANDLVAAEPVKATSDLRYDIAEDPTKFTFSPDHQDADGLPAYGNYFTTQGYIYPEGTLDGHDGVNPDGSPQFPDQVLGQWICYGTHLGEGAKTESGPWVATTQIYQFGKRWGKPTIVTTGYELPEIGAPISRAITGGTGRFHGAGGEQQQTLLGFGEQQGVKLRVRFNLR